MNGSNKSFIIVGGPSRSATDGVSAFLSLHESVAAYSTSVMPPDRKLYYNYFKNAKKTQQPALSDNGLYNNYLRDKNLRLSIDDADIIVLRRDHGEDTLEPLKSIAGEYKETKLIYSLRRNLFNVFTSQAYNMLPRVKGLSKTEKGTPITEWQVEQFHNNITRSFDMMTDLISKYPEDILLVDISYTDDPHYLAERRRYHEKILDFAGLQANDMQKSWMRELPPSNQRNKQEHAKLKQFRIDHSQYKNTFDSLKEHEAFQMVAL